MRRPLHADAPEQPGARQDSALQAKAQTQYTELTEADRYLIHQAVRRLAGRCDHAVKLDGVGFNQRDASFGHDLARWPSLTERQAAAALRMLQKYRRQLGALGDRLQEIRDRIGGGR